MVSVSNHSILNFTYLCQSKEGEDSPFLLWGKVRMGAIVWGLTDALYENNQDALTRMLKIMSRKYTMLCRAAIDDF